MATYLTQEGYNKKMEELSALEAQRPAIKQAIAEARDKGDLSENAEYDAAKEAQGMLEMKISKLKELIASARIIAAIRTTSTGKITAIRTTDARIVSTIGALGIASARVASTYETHIASTRIIPAIIATVAVVNVLSASSTILNQDFASATVVCMIQTTKGTIVDIIFPVDRITGS